MYIIYCIIYYVECLIFDLLSSELVKLGCRKHNRNENCFPWGVGVAEYRPNKPERGET